MLSASWIPASAMTLSAPSPAPHFASAQVQKVWGCRWGCGGGWRGWGWGPAVAGGVIAGAAVGAAVAASHPYPYAYGGPCWRRAYDAYGRPYWRQMC